jgi:hypothetical protein
MKRGMTHAARAELADAIRDRYLAVTGKDKRKILQEFMATTGYHEKSAIRILNNPAALKHRQTRQRTPLYDEAARAALIVMWEAFDRVCGKRLKALLPILLPALERNGHLNLDQEIRSKVLLMSASTIDRYSGCQGAQHVPESPQRSYRSRDGSSECALLPTGMSRRRAAWKWIWWHIAGRSTGEAM